MGGPLGKLSDPPVLSGLPWRVLQERTVLFVWETQTDKAPEDPAKTPEGFWD